MMKALCVCLLVLLAVSVNSTDACGGGDRSCGGTCYSPRTHTCINGYFLCPVVIASAARTATIPACTAAPERSLTDPGGSHLIRG
ncbi:hypothetical protein BOX15_Mlig018268g3 [Macrostomum lignano]|uniref:Uncharacterized protein n=1 Tax=Macrostomum lignano TaxID=282301 RepID=A0A267D9K2_9PLAT|nr:hypothetical protein BOX15_Mlig018268g3 [Macrostomum lignano]